MSDSTKWNKPLDKLMSALDGLSEATLSGAEGVPGVVDEIKTRTPVDEGTARDSFYVGQTIDGRFGIASTDDSGKIIALEYGHSMQAPRGMIVLGGKQFPRIAQKILDRRLRGKGNE